MMIFTNFNTANLCQFLDHATLSLSKQSLQQCNTHATNQKLSSLQGANQVKAKYFPHLLAMIQYDCKYLIYTQKLISSRVTLLHDINTTRA